MLINCNGYQIAAEIIGTTGPTVVLEAGAGMGKAAWDPIWAEVAAFATVFRYDRPGVGESTKPGAVLRTAGDVADQLHRLLGLAEVPGPYLLVGHSFGGLVTRIFAHRYPHDVAGVVLVDSSHPEQRSRSLAVLPAPAPAEAPVLTATRQRYQSATDLLPEGIDFGLSLAEAGEVPGISGVPLAVVSRSMPAGDADLRLRRPGLPPEVAKDLERTWQELQRDLCHPDGLHFIARRGGHVVHQDEPALVVEAIRAVLTSVAKIYTRRWSSRRF